MTIDLAGRSRLELEEERDSLLRSVEDLDGELARGDIDEADHAALKDDYTVRAAAVLRAIEASESAPTPSPPAPAHGPGRRRRRARLVAAAVGVVALVAVAATSVTRSSEERLPGESATGDITATGPSDDVGRGLARARQLTGQGKTLDAIKAYDEVLSLDPRQPEALTYRGWLVRLAGRQAGNPELVDRALEYLNRAVAADPSYPDAHLFRGLVLYQDKGDARAALPEFRAFLDADPPPEMVSLVQDVLRRAAADADAAAGTASTPPAQP